MKKVIAIATLLVIGLAGFANAVSQASIVAGSTPVRHEMADGRQTGHSDKEIGLGSQRNAIPSDVRNVGYKHMSIYVNLTGSDTGKWFDLRNYKTCDCSITIATAGGAPGTATAIITSHWSLTGTETSVSQSDHGSGTIATTSGTEWIGSVVRGSSTTLPPFVKLRVSVSSGATVNASCVARN